ncbi:MAG: pea pathogenicity protein 2 [Schumannella sp.]|jgi:hypothetical protein|nr:pea pathogenicity protein 2 [Schumannella sp.]
MSDSDVIDRQRVRELLENWAVWRDAGDWERFRSVWSPRGRMMATWYQGTAEDFLQASVDGWNRGVRILHFLGGSSIDIVGDRAIAQTKMTITQRAEVEGVECDIICTGRFYDFIEREGGDWKIVLRQPIYEIDRIAAVSANELPVLDADLLATFPAGYRHLAYAQTRIGYDVKTDMPGIDGPEVEALYSRGDDWLGGRTDLAV